MRHTVILLLLLAIPALPGWSQTAPSLGDLSRPWEVDAARLIGSEWLDVHEAPGCEQPAVHQLQRSVPDVRLTGESVTLEIPDSTHGAACPAGDEVGGEEVSTDEADDDSAGAAVPVEFIEQVWVEVEIPGGTGWVARYYLKPHIENESLLCFAYLYGVLGIVFWIGMAYAWRQGDVGFVDRRRRRNLAVMVGGFALYAAVHGFFQFVAPGL